ncbi:MAG TPA: IMP dehydrogenase [Candidatus Hydrogenedentes bacterium]|nr:IMP dehydrogenase [Candidatus Hydrogenedentota bacterium]
MKNETNIPEGLSFDDVLLVPARSKWAPRDVVLTTRLTRTLALNIPLISAAMDTVTESRLAIAIAQEGGIGVIHKNLTAEEQAEEVDRVKRSQAGIITHPFTLTPDQKLRDAEALMARYHISGVPITDPSGNLMGILTNRDLRFEEDMDVPVSSIMTPRERLVTVAPGTTMEEAKRLLHKHRVEKLPIVDERDKLVGLLTIKDIMKARDFPARSTDDMGRLRVGAALGVGPEEIARADALLAAGADVLVVDSAHGHGELVIETVKQIKGAFPEAQVIAGNVVTADGARDLIEAGADAVKVGVGPGAICTTRVIAGVGVPQLTAIMNVAPVCRDADVPVIADGGIKYSGDIAKAIAAGASTVMIGSLFAGTEESPGEKVLYEGRTYKLVRGMGSIKAMQRGSRTRYMQFESEAAKLVPEGIEGRVPYRGNLSTYVFQLMGGLRASMGYCGCGDITAMQRKANFIRMTAAGLRESHPHDVTIIEDAPNYQIPDK